MYKTISNTNNNTKNNSRNKSNVGSYTFNKNTFINHMDYNPPIKFVLFDWGGTLAKKGTRKNFVKNKNPYGKLTSLKPDTLFTLENLKNMNIGVGIISNMTKYPPKEMTKAINDAGLGPYFDLIIFSNERNQCAKPCQPIFQKAINQIGLHPSEILFVGNNYINDILGPKEIGMQTAFLNNKKNFMSKVIEQYGSQDYYLNQLSDLMSIG